MSRKLSPTMTRPRLRALAAALTCLTCAACGTTVSPPLPDAATDARTTVPMDAPGDTPTDTPWDAPGDAPGDASGDMASATDAMATAGHCVAFPGQPTATVTGGGTLTAVIADAARLCAVGSVCFGADSRACVQAYVQAQAGSVSVALLARRGDLSGSLRASGELSAALLYSARDCVSAATDCAAVARCLGAGPVPAAMGPDDDSLCQGARMLVRAHGRCGNDAVVPVDCGAQGLRCITADVGLVWCGAQSCPSADTRPQCQTGPDYRECNGTAQVEGNCAARPWLDTPSCWIDTDDNNVLCGSGQDCDHEYSLCAAGEVAEHCGFHSDAVPNYVRERTRCGAIAPGLHCGPMPGAPTLVGCLAGSACLPGTVTCAGTVATACAFGVPAAVDCAALGGTCSTNGCVGPR